MATRGVVLNPKAFVGAIGNNCQRLSLEEIPKIMSGLEQHVCDGQQ